MAVTKLFLIPMLLVALTAAASEGGPEPARNATDCAAVSGQVIVLFDSAMNLSEIYNILLPLQNRFKIIDDSKGKPLTDFVVVEVCGEQSIDQVYPDFNEEALKLSHVKSTSINRKIKAELSSFSNLHASKMNDPMFFDNFDIRSNHQKATDSMNSELKRELFLKGDYSNLYNEMELWNFHDKGHTGKGIKIAIFDSGISPEVKDQLNVVEKIDFTNDEVETDMISHGTFIASVIGSKNPDCPGIAPDAELYIFKVFNKDHESYTEWFLNAFNYAIEKGIDIINLSNGSSDFQDNPFIDKINEMTENGITVVSSIGNDGPEQGTLNNPADMNNVIGVGSVNKSKKNIAHFSSRGITTWNLLKGVGIVKPDIITLGEKVSGLDMNGQCTVSSGTSVSSGIISGAIAVMLSGIKDSLVKPSPAFIKKTLLTTSEKLIDVPFSDQGSGIFSLGNAFRDMQLYRNSSFINNPLLKPKIQAYIYPPHLDLTSENFYPYSLVSFYSTMMPIGFNFTVINPEVDRFEIEEIKWSNDNPIIEK